MFFNIIIFFIVLIILILLLNYSQDTKYIYQEGFFNFPDANHNTYVADSQTKFNELTNTINLTNPAIPINSQSAINIKLSLNGLTAEPTSDGYKLVPKSDYNIPTNIPNTFKQAQFCEAAQNNCSAFDDPTFATNCGISFDTKGTSMSGKPHIGGLYISPDDRQKQLARAENVLTTGSAPYDPYKVFQPTLGKAQPGTFALTKDQCTVVKEKVHCATKQTFNSPNCAQCYTSQSFARVGPETGRLPSILYLFGTGNVTVSSSNNLISTPQTSLNNTNAVQINIPGNAEGTTFNISVVPNSSNPPFVAGFLQGQTPAGTFKLDLLKLISVDSITNKKPRLNGTIVANGFQCIAIIPGNGQTTIGLNCLMPFSFLNIYDGDALTCDNGPIITQAASATFLESDPCFGKDNQPGNYKLECLQQRWIELGGTQQGTGYPSNKVTADAIQKDAKGNPLDIDTIINNLAPLITSAITGIDANGNSLSLADWNKLSLWATGIPINTPCDTPNANTGPLSKECLSYLYLNQGVTSHIGPTYTLSPSAVASMIGQNSPNTYCQPGTAIDPATAAGLKFGQALGGINNVKQTYDQINRLANDNTQKNDARKQAIQQCYGITLDPMATGAISGPTQVFAVGQGYNYTKDQATNICGQYGAQVATVAQLTAAQKTGADWCFTGWVADSNDAMYPTTIVKPGCGTSPGVQIDTPVQNKAGVNCYGPKPVPEAYPGMILPFNQTSWDQPQGNNINYTIISDGYLETSGPQPSCFSGLSAEQAQTTCNNLANQCAGFSYTTDGSGSGCYKGDLKGGKVVNSGYVGYIKNPQP